MPTDKTVEQLIARVTELEIKQSYYEGGQDDLEQALLLMQTRLDKLSLEFNKIISLIESRSEQQIAPQSEETPPPHY